MIEMTKTARKMMMGASTNGSYPDIAPPVSVKDRLSKACYALLDCEETVDRIGTVIMPSCVREERVAYDQGSVLGIDDYATVIGQRIEDLHRQLRGTLVMLSGEQE